MQQKPNSAFKKNIHKQRQKQYMDRPLSTYAKFSEKLTFLTTSYVHVRVRIGWLEMLVFRKILGTYLCGSFHTCFTISSAYS